MILQALVSCYEALLEHDDENEIPRPGWAPVGVSYALCIDDDGNLEQVLSVKTDQEVRKGKKTVIEQRPQIMQLPMPALKGVSITPSFLCDNSTYFLGIDNKNKPVEWKLKRFQASQALHEKILSGADSPAARAVLSFFRNWDPAQAQVHPALQAAMEDILRGSNLIFQHRGTFVQNHPAIQRAWQTYYDSKGDEPEMVCLVTGRKEPIAILHPNTKLIQGTPPNGASITSFNAPAFCSFDRAQGMNAPVSKYAAFAYGTALNHLLASNEHTFRIGDTVVVSWAENGSSAYQPLFNFSLSGQSYGEGDILNTVRSLLRGEPVDFEGEHLFSDMNFFILGLSPNAARLSVRFFFRNTFGGFLHNIQAHYERLDIVRPAYDKFETLPVWKLLSETVNQASRVKKPSDEMTGMTLRAILTNTQYPATLLNGTVLRIRAEREVTRGRAAILKAYYLKRYERQENPDIPKEVLTVALNPDSTNVPYTLGRLFAVLEAIQSDANPDINATIRDRYFNAAAAIPASVFPTLGNLALKHLKKLQRNKPERASWYQRQLQALYGVLGEEFPQRLNLPQQGSFQLGYYHQTQARYQKKEEK